MSTTVSTDPTFITAGTGSSRRQIAIRGRDGSAPGLFWIGWLQIRHAGRQGGGPRCLGRPSTARACVRFDYSGHGEIRRRFRRWHHRPVAGGLASLRSMQRCQGPQVVVGSSMGGWMALAAGKRAGPTRAKMGRATLKGLVLIAPAPDFTEELMWKRLLAGNPARRSRPPVNGCARRNIRRALSDHAAVDRRGRNHLLLGSAIDGGLPGADSSRQAGSGRALAACSTRCRTAAERGCGS